MSPNRPWMCMATAAVIALVATACGSDSAAQGDQPDSLDSLGSGNSQDGTSSDVPTGKADGPGGADAGKPDTDKPDTDKPDTDKPDTDKPDTDKPDTNRPDTDRPDTDKPDTGKPDTGKPDTGKPDTGKPDADLATDVQSNADATTDSGPGEPDVQTPTCASPTPFVAPGSKTGWKHTSTELFTVTQGGPNHRGQDVVVAQGQSAVLIGKFAYGALDKDLKNEDVEVFVQWDAPCGDWVSLGVTETSEDGEFGATYGISDDGGRVFFTLPDANSLAVGRYPIRMLVHGDHSVAAFDLFVVAPHTEAVVFDIDGTLTTDDFQLVTELFGEIFDGTFVPKYYGGALDVVKAWHEKGYLVVYLTARPDFLKSMTRDSIVAAGFPHGLVHLTDTNAQAVPSSSGAAAYKAQFLAYATGPAQLQFAAAYGNATTDIEAYEAAGFDKSRTFIIGPHAGESGTTALSSGYPAHLPWANSQPPAAVTAPGPLFWSY